jgi:hypothetical protein
MKKRLSLIFSFLLSCFSLSGCGDKPTIEPTNMPTPQPTIEETQEPTLDHSVELTQHPTIEPSYVENDAVEIPLDLPYIEMGKTTYKTTGYDQNMTIETAYEWLKTQPEFEGAEDA